MLTSKVKNMNFNHFLLRANVKFTTGLGAYVFQNCNTPTKPAGKSLNSSLDLITARISK